MTNADWLGWHDAYDQPDSWLQRRLAVVQRRLRDALDTAPPGPISVVSMCAGQGRDLLGVLPDHPRRPDVTARLVELDPRNVALARQAVRAAGLDGVEVVQGDAALCSSYAGAVPADIVLACGVFGNITDEDLQFTVANLPSFCRTGSTVIWTRNVGRHDITPTIREWFADNGFSEVGFDVEDGYPFSVGAHRLTGPALPFAPEIRLFQFIGYAKLGNT
jgi:predicted RNA methylase